MLLERSKYLDFDVSKRWLLFLSIFNKYVVA